MSGSLSLTKAAKAVKVPRNELIAWMLREHWLIREPSSKGGGPLSPTLRAVASGDLVESYHTVTGSSSYRPGFYRKTHRGALVTVQGLDKLRAVFGPNQAA